MVHILTFSTCFLPVFNKSGEGNLHVCALALSHNFCHLPFATFTYQKEAAISTQALPCGAFQSGCQERKPDEAET